MRVGWGRVWSTGADRWLDRLTNIAVIVLVAFVIWSAWRGKGGPADYPPDYKAGDVINLQKVGLSGRGVIIVTRSTCQACSLSLPFYKTLKGISIAAVTDEPVEANRQYLETNGLRFTTLASTDDAGIRVMAIPTLIAVDGTGRVLNAWRGRLTPQQEQDVARIVNSEATP